MAHKQHKVILLPRYESIYFPIPKNANSSMKVAVELLNGISVKREERRSYSYHLRRFALPRNYALENYQHYFKFALVRNPFDRVVSCFTEKIRQDSLTNKWFQNGVSTIFRHYPGSFYKGMTFENFVSALVEIPDDEADAHFRSQFTFVQGEDGEMLVDKLGRFEKIGDFFTDLMEQFDVQDITLPHTNRSQRDSYQTYYNDALREKIARRYQKDLELFDYDFGNT